MAELTVSRVKVDDLEPWKNNPRTHSKKQVKQIARSIEAFGFTNPLLIDDGNGVIAGHGRLEAAKLLGLERVPTIRLADMSEAQKRAYVIADNKLAENAGWDEPLLKFELQYLVDLEVPELDFALLTGFETPEIDLILDDGPDEETEEEIPLPQTATEPTSVFGDLWMLGNHRLLCGDATDRSTMLQLMDGSQAQMVFSDPPYNVAIGGNVSGLGRVQHDEFKMASGEMSKNEFTAFLTSALSNMADASVDGALHYICMDWRHMEELLEAGSSVYRELKNLCVWAKTNGGMGSFYRSQHELVFVYKHGTAAHINNVALGKYGRNRTNVWTYAGVNSLKSGRREELVMHPTVKPLSMVEDAIKDCTDRGDIILDAFAGSGTTLIAAETTGRVCYAMELDPKYVDVILRRWSELTGREPVHALSGLTFKQLS